MLRKCTSDVYVSSRWIADIEDAGWQSGVWKAISAGDAAVKPRVMHCIDQQSYRSAYLLPDKRVHFIVGTIGI